MAVDKIDLKKKIVIVLEFGVKANLIACYCFVDNL